MAMQILFLLCMLNGLSSAIYDTSVLTYQENYDRRKDCGNFPVFGTPHHANVSCRPHKIGSNYACIMPISQKHVVTLSNTVFQYNAGRLEWIHNGSVFDSVAYCKRGMRYLQLPKNVILQFSNIYQFPVLQGYILNICVLTTGLDVNLTEKPMILALSEKATSFACIPDADEKKLSVGDTYFSYRYDSKKKMLYTVTLEILPSSGVIQVKISDGEYRGGSVIRSAGGLTTLIGVATKVSPGIANVILAREISNVLCDLFGICNNILRYAITTGGPLTSTASTATVAHSSSTSNTGGQQQVTSATNVAVAHSSSTSNTGEQKLDKFTTNVAHSSSKNNTGGQQQVTSTINITHLSRTLYWENTTTIPQTSSTERDTIVFFFTDYPDYTDEEDAEYLAFLEEYKADKRKKYGSGRNQLLNVELCVLILVAVCLIN